MMTDDDSGDEKPNHSTADNNDIPTRRGSITAKRVSWVGTDVLVLDEQQVDDVEYSNEELSNTTPKSRESDELDDDELNAYHRVSTNAMLCPHWRRDERNRIDIVPTIEQIISWEFDILVYKEDVLVEIVERLLDYYKCYERFGIQREVMRSFIEKMRSHHPIIEYHNWYHAAGTMHACFLFLTLGGADQMLEEADIFALLVGALAHDVFHTGQNNDYHVKINSGLAKQYQNQSVLENHSVTKSLEILQDDGADILAGIETEEEKEYIKEYFRLVILSTDPANHGKLSDQLTQKVNQQEEYRSNKNNTSPPPPIFDKSKKEDRILLGEMICHAADISAPAHSNPKVVRDWCQRICSEFRRQASMEREAGLAVTPYMDGLTSEVQVMKLQVDFCTFMVLPLFTLIAMVLPQASIYEQNCRQNIGDYKQLIREATKRNSI